MSKRPVQTLHQRYRLKINTWKNINISHQEKENQNHMRHDNSLIRMAKVKNSDNAKCCAGPWPILPFP